MISWKKSIYTFFHQTQLPFCCSDILIYTTVFFKNCSITQKEGLALVAAVEKYKHYLADKHFLALTDHISLKWLKSIKDTKGRLGRWSLLLQPYNYDIKHKSGKTNTNADCLSRRPYALTEPQTPLDLVHNLPVVTTILGESDIKGESQADKQIRGPAKYNPVTLMSLGRMPMMKN